MHGQNDAEAEHWFAVCPTLAMQNTLPHITSRETQIVERGPYLLIMFFSRAGGTLRTSPAKLSCPEVPIVFASLRPIELASAPPVLAVRHVPAATQCCVHPGASMRWFSPGHQHRPWKHPAMIAANAAPVVPRVPDLPPRRMLPVPRGWLIIGATFAGSMLAAFRRIGETVLRARPVQPVLVRKGA